MTNTDKVTAYILEHVKELEPAKIRAMADVVRALGGEIEKAPNQMETLPDDPNLVDEEQPLDLSKVTGVVVDGKKQNVKIFSN